jgi:hypothetical protein
MALKAQFHGSYKKYNKLTNTALTVFRYTVTGSDEELKSYEEIQGDNFVQDDKTGKPLYFTTRYVDDNVELTITENGKVVVDDSEYTKIQSIIDSYGEGVARLMLMKKSAQ